MNKDQLTGRLRPVTDQHVANIYRAAAGALAWSEVLESLTLLTDSKFCFIGRYSVNEGRGTIEEWCNLDVSAVEAYAVSSVGSVPWLARQEYFQSAGLVWTGRQILSDEHLRETIFFENFLRPLDVFHTLHAAIDISFGTVTHVFMARSNAKQDYSPELCETFRDLTWHLSSAFDLSRTLSERSIIEKGFDVLLENLPIGLAVLDPNDTIIRMNKLAQRTLASFGEEVDSIGAEIPSIQRSATSLPAALAKMISEPRGHSRFVLSGHKGRCNTYLTVLPLDLGKTWTDHQNSGRILLICDLEFEIEVDESVLGMIHHLTPTEARLAARVITGARIDEAAHGMGISESTARTHLKRIFSKTNVTRQADLVRKLLLSTIHSTKIKLNDT
jgi:DNA-binding CsgD family transcriptional regulator/PAS domain-containing protein